MTASMTKKATTLAVITIRVICLNLVMLGIGFCLIFSGKSAHAEKYILTMKTQKDFARVWNELKKTGHSTTKNHISFLGLPVKKVVSLKHLEIFILESKTNIISTLQNKPGVHRVEKNIIFQGLDPRFKEKIISNIHTSFNNTPVHNRNGQGVWGDNKKLNKHPLPSQIHFFSLPHLLEEAPPPLTWGLRSIHASKAWAHSQGTNVKVLVIDTGVDKDHIELEGKVEKGANFYQDDSKDVPYPYYDDHGHGTHVAGTVVGTTVGVAPKAKLLSAKVCGFSGRCDLAAMLASINWGVEEKVDVINISIGGPRASEAERVAYAKVTEAGVFVVAAAGNSGTPDLAYPARFESVFSVGAINEKMEKARFSQYGPDLNLVAPGESIKSSTPGEAPSSTLQVDGFGEVENVAAIGTNVPEAPVQGPLVHIGYGQESDVKDLDLTGKVALISRGKLSFLKKVQNAISKGAIGVIIHNNTTGLMVPTLDKKNPVSIPVVSIGQSDGENIRTQLDQEIVVNTSIAIVLKPAYEYYSGTSMSSPHVTGVAALIKSAYTGLKEKDIKDILLKTATDLMDTNKFGAGLVNAEAAVIEAIKRKEEGEKQPPDEGETPPDESETPPDEGETPPDEGKTPPDEGETPPDEGETPPDEGETPPDEGEGN